MKSPAKARARRITEEVCGETVSIDLLAGPAGGSVSASASVMHLGDKPSAVVDLSLSTDEPRRLRELATWLLGVADFLSDAAA